NVESLRPCARLGFIDVANCDHLGVRCFRPASQMELTDGARTCNAYSKFVVHLSACAAPSGDTILSNGRCTLPRHCEKKNPAKCGVRGSRVTWKIILPCISQCTVFARLWRRWPVVLRRCSWPAFDRL